MGLSPDNQYYEKTIFVPYPECDLTNHWKLSGLMRGVQQTAAEHLDAMGLTADRLYQEGMVFLLSREMIVFHREIGAGEELTLRTWPVKPKGAQFLRTVSVMDREGKLAAKAYTSWMLVDPVEHKIYRPSAFPYPLRPAEGEEDERKIASTRAKAAEMVQPGIPLTVRYSNADSNGHLNNAVYGDLVMDCLPVHELERMRPSRFLIHYIKEAKLGAEVTTKLGRLEQAEGQEQWYFSGQVQGEDCFEANLVLQSR